MAVEVVSSVEMMALAVATAAVSSLFYFFFAAVITTTLVADAAANILNQKKRGELSPCFYSIYPKKNSFFTCFPLK